MFTKLFQSKKKKQQQECINTLYKVLMEQARQPEFYQDLKVPDTVDGRFDMIILHMFFIFTGLETHKEEASDVLSPDFYQDLFDCMFHDMEESLREQGVGDLGIPKHIKRMMIGFNGRIESYHKAITENDDDLLTMALKKNIYFGSKIDDGNLSIYLNKLLNYIKVNVKDLTQSKTCINDIKTNNFVFSKITKD